jgi:eukaryotic-like serine/threonine-protein kinase
MRCSTPSCRDGGSLFARSLFGVSEISEIHCHRGIVVNFPWGALARLSLARAYAVQGDTAKAKAAYQDFPTLWEDADPGIPILIASKAEYAKLQ